MERGEPYAGRRVVPRCHNDDVDLVSDMLEYGDVGGVVWWRRRFDVFVRVLHAEMRGAVLQLCVFVSSPLPLGIVRVRVVDDCMACRVFASELG